MKILLGLVTTFALSVMIVAVGFSGAMGVFFGYYTLRSGGAESDRGFEVRVIRALGRGSTVTPLVASVTGRENEKRNPT